MQWRVGRVASASRCDDTLVAYFMLLTPSVIIFSPFYVLLISRDNEPTNGLANASHRIASAASLHVLAYSVGDTLNGIIINWSVAIGPCYATPTVTPSVTLFAKRRNLFE